MKPERGGGVWDRVYTHMGLVNRSGVLLVYIFQILPYTINKVLS